MKIDTNVQLRLDEWVWKKIDEGAGWHEPTE